MICTRCDKNYDDIFMEVKNINDVKCTPFRFKQTGQCWCFCVVVLYKWITEHAHTNPMTREPLSKQIIERLKKEYLAQDTIGSKPDDSKLIEFIDMVVDTQNSMALKYHSKPTIEKTADSVYEIMSELYELDDDKENLANLDMIKSEAIVKLKKEGRR
jgi:hypothetical protein